MTIAQTTALVVVVFGLSVLGVSLRPDSSAIAVWWPASGAVFGALALSNRHRWPALLMAAFAGSLAANLVGGRPVSAAAAFALANCAEGGLGVWLFRGRRFQCRRLGSIEDLVRLCLTAVVAAAVAGLGAAVATRLLLDGDPLQAWRSFVFAHVGGVLLIAPTMLIRRRSPQPIPSGRWVELAVQLVTTAVVVWLVFRPDQHLPLAYLVLPALAWSALRLTPWVTAVELFALGCVASIAPLYGGGPLSATAHPEFALDVGFGVSLTQLFVAVVTVAALALALENDDRVTALLRVGEREELFRRTFDEALLGMAMLELRDGQAVFTRVNTAAARMLGRPLAQIPGRAWEDFLDPADRETVRTALTLLREGGGEGWREELRYVGQREPRWLEVALTPMRAADGTVSRVSAQLADVTERRRAEERLQELALRDALTGLPNRSLFTDRLAHALRDSGRSGDRLAVLFCDIDDFKNVNDSAGHHTGDDLLVEVGRRLEQSVRPGDTVARLGGDEFVILCPHVPDVRTGHAVAERLLDTLRQPVTVGGVAYRVGGSLGLAMSHADSTVESLMREADTAMYAAKKGGKNRVERFAEEHHARAARTARLERDLHRALEQAEFRLHVQPVVDLATGRIVAGETLVRWEDPARGLLPPAEWLDVAEASSIIHDLGRWILDESCRLAAGWAEELGAGAPQVHVNISARQLNNGRLVPDVLHSLERSGLPADRLVLELTETHLEQVRDGRRNDLEALAAAGVTIAADDFGTGYSPLTRLTDMPVDMIKIDRTFVAGMGTDERARAIVQGILGIGRALGLQVVAEGVETPAQAAELARLGCLTAQGYLWSPPRHPAAFVGLLRDGPGIAANGEVSVTTEIALPPS